MYFGTRKVFDYLKCSNCGCLQLINPPKEFSRYYPKNYFTYQQSKEGKVKSILNRYRDRAAMGEKSLLGNILLKRLGEPTYITRLKIAEIGFNDSILDVGCGKGILLHKMKESGFQNVHGIDPFLDETIVYKNGLKILKQNFDELEGRFDLIMFNHSFEHMENPDKVMKHANKLLNTDKYLLLRIPVADSFTFKHYQENWCSLDAPRHLFLHTKKSISILAQQAGFEIKKINYDSRSWQFWGSEQYSKDIPLINDKSYFINPDKSIFTKDQINEFERKTFELNKKGEGDQAEFYMKKFK
jgi:SAM-dependent methyltransferase